MTAKGACGACYGCKVVQVWENALDSTGPVIEVDSSDTYDAVWNTTYGLEVVRKV
jgi:hypothetical protein